MGGRTGSFWRWMGLRTRTTWGAAADGGWRGRGWGGAAGAAVGAGVGDGGEDLGGASEHVRIARVTNLVRALEQMKQAECVGRGAG
jgi:hypothetical protein